MQVISPNAAVLLLAIAAALLAVAVVVLARKISALQAALRDSAPADALTGLHSRGSFYLLGEQAVLDAKRAAGPLTVFCFRLDGPPPANDRDRAELLRDIATILRATFRRSDVLGRLTGDEFAAITRGRQAE